MSSMGKPVIWMGSSLKSLKKFPKAVQRHIGFALYRAQRGNKHEDAKPMKGLGSGVMEIASRYDKDARQICSNL